jgi:hypothetical protein
VTASQVTAELANGRQVLLLVLVTLEHLGPEQLGAARRAALALEDRASVYGRTEPAEVRPAGAVD